MVLLDLLPEGEIFDGFIVRTTDGHAVILSFKKKTTPEELRKIQRNLLTVPLLQARKNDKITVKDVMRIRGDKHSIKKEVQRLNKEAGFSCSESNKCQKMA